MTTKRKPRPAPKAVLTNEKVHKQARECLANVLSTGFQLEASMQVRAFNTLMDRARFKSLLTDQEDRALCAELREALAKKGFAAVKSLSAPESIAL